MRGGCCSPAAAVRSGGCCALCITRRLTVKLQPRMADSKPETVPTFIFLYYFYIPFPYQWISNLKYCRTEVRILLEEEKGRMYAINEE